MIVYSDRGATLRCTGCDAFIELTHREIVDQHRSLERKAAMGRVHEACDSFRNKSKAAEAIKARRRAYRREGVTSV